MPGFPVLHYLPEFAQTHVHWFGDAIQSSHPLLPPSSLVLNLSQHESLFQWTVSVSGGQSIEASVTVLPVNIRCWFPLGFTGLISLLSKGLSRVFTTFQKHEFFSAQPFLWSNCNICTWLLGKPQLSLCGPLSAKWRWVKRQFVNEEIQLVSVQ